MNNEIAPVLDMLEELKQECKAISKAQAALHTALTEQPANSKSERTTTQETVQIHLSKETQAKIKEHQLFVLEALSQSSKKLDPKFEALQQLIREQQKPVEYKSYSLFASVQLAERMLLLLVCGLVMVSCWFFAMGANQLQTASDYDLRYRYLRMQGKGSPVSLLRLAAHSFAKPDIALRPVPMAVPPMLISCKSLMFRSILRISSSRLLT